MFEFLIAFGAGLISFLSPCVLPLIPGYVSYISGQSLQEILESKKTNFFPLVLFCLGFSTVFVLLGASASFLGQALLQNSEVLRIIAGIIIVIFSFQLLGIINISFLNFEKRFDAKESRNILFPYVIILIKNFFDFKFSLPHKAHIEMFIMVNISMNIEVINHIIRRGNCNPNCHLETEHFQKDQFENLVFHDLNFLVRFNSFMT